ncbi:beta-lactamase/transpeptidase-like protein [Obba rivulosa]|uniref:Beta-lactamase/transpeptidase-like protein n=1 Tax=Obba rivulosa TaxID=1052685 RepID=A0A8E2B099_9APHY|nr:beta-lactamase/transpeptidase-like protein [Obba rivulosa]
MNYMQLVVSFLGRIASAVLHLGDASLNTVSYSGPLESSTCLPFLPKVFIETPPSSDHPLLQATAREVHEFLSDKARGDNIDSLSVAVVTADGPVFEQNYGPLRANESNTSPAMDSQSMYRIASVSKLFAVMEGHILAQKGVISWDDPVRKYLPDLTYRLDGFRPGSEPVPMDDAPITLFQLASHMSGLGRDWPPGNATDFPNALSGGGPPPVNGLPFPSRASLFESIAEHHLVSPPYSYPSYSNTATGLLGLALVAANRAASQDPSHEPETYAELVKRDLFDPMGLHGSHFLATAENKHRVVVPSMEPEVADMDFLDSMNSAGGQFLSLSDSITVIQTLLNPDHPNSLLTRYTLDKWMQPVHDFEEDDWTQIGHIWEIVKARDSNGRLRKIYWKLGDVGGYHAAIAIHPGTSYGLAVLMAGRYADDAWKIAYDLFGMFQPAVDGALSELCRTLYAGTWLSEDRDSQADITVEKGTMFVNRLILNGSDVLALFETPNRVALRPTERRDELRLDIGDLELNGKKHMGCMPYWNAQDTWGIRNNAPINLLYFTDGSDSRVLHYPSVDVVMRRLPSGK